MNESVFDIKTSDGIVIANEFKKNSHTPKELREFYKHFLKPNFTSVNNFQSGKWYWIAEYHYKYKDMLVNLGLLNMTNPDNPILHEYHIFSNNIKTGRSVIFGKNKLNEYLKTCDVRVIPDNIGEKIWEII